MLFRSAVNARHAAHQWQRDLRASGSSANLKNICVVHIAGTLDYLPGFGSVSGVQLLKLHLEPAGISADQFIQITQRHCRKNILALAAHQYVDRAHNYLELKLADALARNPNLKFIFTGFSQGGGVTVQLAAKFLDQHPELAKRISVIAVNGSMNNSRVSLLPASLSQKLGSIIACLPELRAGSRFLDKNIAAIELLKAQDCLVDFVHTGVDFFVSHEDAGAEQREIRTLQWILTFLVGGAAIIATGGVGLLPVFFSFCVLGISSHALSPMHPLVGEKIRARVLDHLHAE